MCGIAGLLRVDGGPVDAGQLTQMAQRLAHRGPDGQSLHIEPGLGLAHRRLSIIDLAGGTQPMANEAATVVIVFNGEIYNFVALRTELTAAGHRFATQSDSECVVHGWEEWGPGLVDRLEGMFVFAVWDRPRGLLFLGRDRIGKKPLHYTWNNGVFAFASELRGLAGLPGTRRINPFALDDYLALGYVPDPATIFEGIHKLPPAHVMRLDVRALAGGAPLPRPERYWSPAAMQDVPDFDTAATLLRGKLLQATEARLVADVPLGAFLSGGVDSAAVVAAAARVRLRQGGPALDTFTIGLPGSEDEAPAAAAIARHCGATHTVDRADGVDWIAAAAQQGRVFGEPFGDPSAVLTLQVCQLARRHVTVALSGDGGDEVFGGYRRHRWHMLVDAARRHIPARIRHSAIASIARIYPKLDAAPRFLRAKHTLTELSLDSALGYYRMSARCQDEQRQTLLHPAMRAALGDYQPSERFAGLMEASGCDDPLRQAQYADLATWLPGQMLTKVDRTSMASSLEVRSPLLDHRLVSWGLGLPADYKIRPGLGKRGRGKAVLRAAVADWLPEGALDRPKQGFATPLADTLRAGMKRVRQRLLGADFLDFGLIRAEAVARMLDDHEAGRFDHAQPIWLLLVLDGFLASEMAAQPMAAEAA